MSTHSIHITRTTYVQVSHTVYVIGSVALGNCISSLSLNNNTWDVVFSQQYAPLLSFSGRGRSELFHNILCGKNGGHQKTRETVDESYIILYSWLLYY